MCRKLVSFTSLVLVLGFTVTSGAHPNPVGWWKLDGDLLDSSGNDRNGTLNGSPTFVPGVYSEALEFHGNPDRVVMEGYQGVVGDGTDTPAWSVAAWVRTTGNGEIVGWGSTGGGNRMEFRINNGRTRAEGGGGNTQGDTTVNDGQWHHIAMTVAPNSTYNSGVNLYLDGVLDTRTNTDPDPYHPVANFDVRFGQRYNNTDRWYTGLIDDLRIYDKELTLGEVQEAMAGIGPIPPTVASKPSPADKDPDLPYYVNELSWTPGNFAKTHTVYYSTRFDDVNDATATALIAQGLTATTLEVPATELETTYYWRVDEVNGAPDFTIHAGDVWNFTTEAVANLVTNVTATADSQFNDTTGPENTVNGSGLTDGLHGIAETDMWLSTGLPATIQFDFDQSYSLHEMHVWNQNQSIEGLLGFGAKDVTLEVSTNGTDFTAVDSVGPLNQGPGTRGYAANTTIALNGVQARSLRMTITSGQGFIGKVGLSEVQFTSIPAFPREFSPADGGEAETLDLTLSWRAGRHAAEHRVLVGDEAAVEDGSAETVTTTEKSLAPADLAYGQLKHWQVIDVAADGTLYPSDIMSFFTPARAALDDMEGYKDEENLEIWASWADGFDDPGNNGSVVGNGDTGSPERVEVYEGRQSLPMKYDLRSASVAEATQTFGPALDLKVGAPDNLGIYFQGDPNNGAASVTLTVTDSAGKSLKVSHPDPAATLLTDWTLLSVAISDLSGVNVSTIRSMTIGVEGAGATGKIFVDYLHVGRPYQAAAPVEASSEGLIAHYEFEGDGSDSAGRNHGTLFGNATIIADGKIGQGLNLAIIPDVNDVNVPGYVAIDNFFYEGSGMPEVTVTTWVRISGENDQVLVSFDRNEYWRLEINGYQGVLGTTILFPA